MAGYMAVYWSVVITVPNSPLHLLSRWRLSCPDVLSSISHTSLNMGENTDIGGGGGVEEWRRCLVVKGVDGKN